MLHIVFSDDPLLFHLLLHDDKEASQSAFLCTDQDIHLYSFQEQRKANEDQSILSVKTSYQHYDYP